jgi:iron-sulfur cluster assembly protein
MSKLLLNLTSKCISNIITKSNNKERLRIVIDSGGCNGLSYNYIFDKQINKDDILIEHNGAKLIIDNISATYVKGSTLDYKDEMIRSGFSISNPRVIAMCGCGTSFHI